MLDQHGINERCTTLKAISGLRVEHQCRHGEHVFIFFNGKDVIKDVPTYQRAKKFAEGVSIGKSLRIRGNNMENEMKNNGFFVQTILSKLRPQIDMVDDECFYTILRLIKVAEFCGWSDEDIVSFCRCIENINPQLSEDVALERMKAIHNKYLNSSNRDTIDSITIDGIIDDNSK